jgi:signal transduction histidine kinase
LAIVDQQQATILVVDDQPDNFDTIELLLTQEGYRLDYADSGAEAIAYLENTQPDVILLDVMMPEMDGFEACRRIKANPQWQHLPIVMVTALSSKADLARCLEAGSDDFISKPVNGTELRARVRSMLRIKRQYDALDASLQLREDLSNMIVHDLRSPLASIFLACEVLELTDLREKQQRKVDQIQIAGRQLKSMVDSLLIMAKLESGKMLLNRVEVDLAQLGQQVISDFEPMAAQKRLQLIAHLPKLGQLFRLDATVLRRVFDNLLSNAIKFSPSGSQITFTIDYPTATQVRIQVADQGQGVKAEFKEQIFQKFAVGELRQGVFQIGLGLAFCQMAIAAHGGTITVVDNHPSGAIFVVELEQS